MLRRFRAFLAVSVLSFIALLTTPGAVVAQAPPPKPASAAGAPPAAVPSPPVAAAIPMAEVAARAAEVPSLIGDLTAGLIHSGQLERLSRRLPELQARIDADLEATKLLGEQAPLHALHEEEQRWRVTEREIVERLDLLTRQATLVQGALTRLSDLQTVWRATRDAARASDAPAPVLQQIDTTLAAVEAAQGPLEAERTMLLDLQANVAPEMARAKAELAQLVRAQERAIRRLLERQSPPIWSLETWRQVLPQLLERTRAIAAGRWATVVRYAHDFSRGLLLHVAILLGFAAVFGAARRSLRRPAAAGDQAMGVLERPWAAAFLAALFVASGPLSAAPLVLRSMFQILLLVPLIRLIRPRISPRLVPSLYIAAILFAVDGVRQSIVDAPALAQILLVLEAIAAASALAHSLRAGVFRRDSASPAFRAAAGLALTALVVALVAGGLGYTPVGRLLASAVLGSAVLALTLYASVQVVAGVVALALHVWPLRLLQMVQHHRDLLERRARVVLAWLAVALWVFRTLEYMALYEPASLVLASVLGTKVGRGEIQISVRDILEFVLTVVFAYLVSAFIRFVLREDVYPHTQMSRGLTYAVSSLLNYVILAFGFVVALGALGVRLDRLTVLAGAFGVGIGFGLQSVVNNFVSGLILLFERPVHVGDIIEVGSLSGEVSRIGIRASTVRTWQGAEIIVPNAQFVTQQVTNWTLSDRTRRIDMPVGVDYGSPPDKVIEVLVAVARKHPEIMRTPAPQAVFKGFGDSSINFELRAWTNRFERWPNIQTELAAGVYAALHAAGMSLPFPQREVRLLGEAPRGPKAP